MNRIEQIAQNERVQMALGHLVEHAAGFVETAVAIQQIAAPTFAEKKRADYVQSRFEMLGLQDVSQDDLHNVYGRYPASHPTHPPVVLSAHSDTVFPAETDLTVRRNGRFVYGPGLGDNASGIAGLLHLAQTLQAAALPLSADVWFVVNVGEEGLGDLAGMKAVVERFGGDAVYIVVEGGLYGQISHQALGVRRFRIEVETDGGHSWGNFGQSSAIHELARLITTIDNLIVPLTPKTTYNVGVVEGGTSVNTIAASAHMQLDLRSEEPEALRRLVGAIEQIVVDRRLALGRDGRSDVAIAMIPIGSRPGGDIQRQTPLVVWAEAALRYAGCSQVHYVVSSTDANVPLSQGMTAVCVGCSNQATPIV